ncbi:MAG: hypothetical protein ACE5GW_11965 [Planctomycetota bacterium]
MGFWLSGLDEAGYGPMLGPLVIGLATFRSEEPIPSSAPWGLLSPAVGRKRASKRIAVADSKALHRPSAGDLSPLEAGVLAFVACERGGSPPATFRELVEHLTAGRSAYLDEYPWYRGRDLPLPTGVPALELVGMIRRLERACARAGLEVTELRAIPLEVGEFNRSLEARSTKGEVNAWGMGRLLRWLWLREERDRAEAWTDRLGGRLRYGSLLYPLFPGSRFQIVEQERERQCYRVEDPGRGRVLTIHFQKECEESSFPTALASMTAKYLRELHMLLFNRWWQEQDPALRATAGYPQDARRFLGDIDPLRRRLGIAGGLLIRRR